MEVLIDLISWHFRQTLFTVFCFDKVKMGRTGDSRCYAPQGGKERQMGAFGRHLLSSAGVSAICEEFTISTFSNSHGLISGSYSPASIASFEDCTVVDGNGTFVSIAYSWKCWQQASTGSVCQMGITLLLLIYEYVKVMISSFFSYFLVVSVFSFSSLSKSFGSTRVPKSCATTPYTTYAVYRSSRFTPAPKNFRSEEKRGLYHRHRAVRQAFALHSIPAACSISVDMVRLLWRK